jgi:hypothetical protein
LADFPCPGDAGPLGDVEGRRKHGQRLEDARFAGVISSNQQVQSSELLQADVFKASEGVDLKPTKQKIVLSCGFRTCFSSVGLKGQNTTLGERLR